MVSKLDQGHRHVLRKTTLQFLTPSYSAHYFLATPTQPFPLDFTTANANGYKLWSTTLLIEGVAILWNVSVSDTETLFKFNEKVWNSSCFYNWSSCSLVNGNELEDCFSWLEVLAQSAQLLPVPTYIMPFHFPLHYSFYSIVARAEPSTSVNYLHIMTLFTACSLILKKVLKQLVRRLPKNYAPPPFIKLYFEPQNKNTWTFSCLLKNLLEFRLSQTY